MTIAPWSSSFNWIPNFNPGPNTIPNSNPKPKPNYFFYFISRCQSTAGWRPQHDVSKCLCSAPVGANLSLPRTVAARLAIFFFDIPCFALPHMVSSGWLLSSSDCHFYGWCGPPNSISFSSLSQGCPGLLSVPWSICSFFCLCMWGLEYFFPCCVERLLAFFPFLMLVSMFLQHMRLLGWCTGCILSFSGIMEVCLSWWRCICRRLAIQLWFFFLFRYLDFLSWREKRCPK